MGKVRRNDWGHRYTAGLHTLVCIELQCMSVNLRNDPKSSTSELELFFSSDQNAKMQDFTAAVREEARFISTETKNVNLLYPVGMFFFFPQSLKSCFV